MLALLFSFLQNYALRGGLCVTYVRTLRGQSVDLSTSTPKSQPTTGAAASHLAASDNSKTTKTHVTTHVVEDDVEVDLKSRKLEDEADVSVSDEGSTSNYSS